MLSIYNCVILPLQISLDTKIFSNETDMILERVGNFTDVIFLMDMIFSFRTTYINKQNGLEVTSGKKIARNYITSGVFFMDFVATFPFDTII